MAAIKIEKVVLLLECVECSSKRAKKIHCKQVARDEWNRNGITSYNSQLANPVEKTSARESVATSSKSRIGNCRCNAIYNLLVSTYNIIATQDINGMFRTPPPYVMSEATPADINLEIADGEHPKT